MQYYNNSGTCPDRTILPKKLALSLASIDVMSPDIVKDPITLNLILGINNAGAQSGNITVKIKMLNLQSSITALRETKEIGVIPEKSTKEISMSFVVPNKYDYDLEVQLYEAGAMISYGKGRITLAPPPQYIVSDGKIISIPEKKAAPPMPMVTPTPIAIPTPFYEKEAKIGQFQIRSGGQSSLTPAPGFAAIGAILGLLLVVYLIKRRGG